jgi:hypothetical protein
MEVLMDVKKRKSSQSVRQVALTGAATGFASSR